jgi:type IV pilus assembly protein PilM
MESRAAFGVQVASDIEMSYREPSDTAAGAPADPFDRVGAGEPTLCGQCGRPNAGPRKFCTGCGASLHEPCPHCQALCSAGEKFCGTCGVNLAAAMQQLIEQFEAEMATVESLRAANRYDEAMAMLGPMSRAGHPRLARHAARAGQLVRQLLVERERRRAAAEEAFNTAQQLLAEHHYRRAVRVLQQIPEPLRDPKFCELLAGALATKEEIATLGRELRAALESKRVPELLLKLDRLLALAPDDVAARRLAGQVQERLCRATGQKLAQFRYEEARRLLESVPVALRTAATTEGYERAAELACLSRHLRSAPLVDATLAALAERFRKLAPGDAQMAKLTEQLLRRWSRAGQEGRREGVPWVAAPPGGPLGFPIEGPPALRHIVPGEALDPALAADCPHQFAVACGLALQGLGKSHLTIDLLPDVRRGALGAVTRSLLGRRASAAWGVDTGSSSVKAVRLAWDAKRKAVVLEAAVRLEYRKPLSQAADADEQNVLVEEALQQLAAQQKLKGARVGLALPGRLTVMRHLTLPAADPAKLAAMVAHEAPRQLPVQLADLVWDHQALDAEPDASAPAEGGRKNIRVLFAGARRNLVEKWLEGVRRAGLRPDFAQSECLALHNFFQYEQTPQTQADAEAKPQARAQAKTEAQPAAKAEAKPAGAAPQAAPEAVALLDLGGEAGNFVVTSPRGVWSRQLGFGGHGVTRALAKQFNVTLAEAERIKQNPALAPSVHQFYVAVEPALQGLLKEIEFCLGAFAKADPHEPIARMIGLGGSFQLHGLLGYLRTGH